ncbi:hypothetical protein SH591_07065 [Sphingomonas sp. LY54]|uniref:hypothetical protein n=1 Tax=Sphingomonadales TaxID=204457 RepID=UPI002ADED98E|nr:MULTISPECIES: hypothetical protein [Sphingomonadales]MEA1015398.1 hypothetical protein [Sphingosinicella sp. LY1275]WRP29930.1 hypothetical protein SH591_07065 [Sphingomonas sp. LY54]
MPQILSAVFDTRAEAERALTDLRAAGVRESALSLIARDEGHGAVHEARSHDGDGDGDATRTGIGVGMTAGALLGFGALLIPGVGPFLAAGALAETLGVAGGAIAAGAVAGAAAGGLAGALRDHGVSDEDAHYYEEHVNRGGVFVSVDAERADISPVTVQDILYNAGGHSAARARTAAL